MQSNTARINLQIDAEYKAAIEAHAERNNMSVTRFLISLFIGMSNEQIDAIATEGNKTFLEDKATKKAILDQVYEKISGLPKDKIDEILNGNKV